jgi:hypothetical protein
VSLHFGIFFFLLCCLSYREHALKICYYKTILLTFELILAEIMEFKSKVILYGPLPTISNLQMDIP